MPIRVICGQGHKLNVPDNLAGQKVRCPKCKGVVVVPAGTEAEQPTLAEAAPAPAPKPIPAPKRSGKGWKWAVALGGILLVLLGAGVAGYLVFTPKKTGPDPAQDREAVRELARRFIEATKGNDSSWRDLLTDKAREQVARGKPFRVGEAMTLRPGMTMQVGEPTITGDTAQVTVTMREAGKQEQLVLNLRRQGKEFRIRGLEIPVAEGQPALPIDFEDPAKLAKTVFGDLKDFGKEMEQTLNKGFEDTMTGKPSVEDLANEALKPLDRTAFDATWKGSLAVENKPARAVLQDLAKGLDLKLNMTPAQEKALDRAITLKLDDRSRYERIEAICRETGLYPVYADAFESAGGKPGVALKQLPRPFPVAFAGPFLVEVTELHEYVPHAAGLIDLRVLASGLPPAVAKILERGTAPLVVTEVVDAMGRDLHDRSRWDTGTKVWKNIPGGYDRPFSVPLKNLLRDVAAIKSLRGKVRIPFPARVDSLRFEPPTAGAVQKAGDVEVKIARWNKSEMNFNGKKYPQHSLSVEVKGVGPDRIKVVAYDAQKKLRGVSSSGWGGTDKQGTAQFTIQSEAPAAVVVKIIGVEHAEYEFHLENVPLSSAGRMPEKLAPAAFPGHETPMSVEFVRTMKDNFMTKAQLRITNHADKPIRSVNLKLDYHDKAGKSVGNWPNLEHSAQAKPEQKDLPLLVAKNATALIEVSAPFLPASATTIKVVPTKVTFADATVWSAGK
jgi:hypothetical protein